MGHGPCFVAIPETVSRLDLHGVLALSCGLEDLTIQIGSLKPPQTVCYSTLSVRRSLIR